MVAVWLLSMAWVVWLGYWVMGRVDAFIDGGGFADDPRPAPILLLYLGECHEADEPAADALPGSWELIETPEIRPDVSPKVVAALSEDDLENILLSTQARRMCPQCVTIARLNDPAYAGLFKRAHISHVVRGELSVRELLNIAQGGRASCDCI